MAQSLPISLLVVLALLTQGASAQSPASQPSPQYLAAMAKRSVINPAGTSTAQVRAMSEKQRLAVFDKMMKKADPGACKPNALRLSELTPDNRSLWNISCRGNAAHLDYSIFLPSSPDRFAQVLKCAPSPGGGSRCSAF